MTISVRHLLHQGPMIRALGNVVVDSVVGSVRRRSLGHSAARRQRRLTQAPPAALVRDFIRHLGGDPEDYRDTIPPHLFPQWTLPVAARTLRGLPYPLHRVLNSGCRLQINAPLRADRPLEVEAWLEEIDENPRRVLIRQRGVTSQPGLPRALVADLYAVIPFRRKGSAESAAREVTRVPVHATRQGGWELGREAGLDFALLTGDLNPVHWLPRYAQAFGYPGPILHGFATLARVVEGLRAAAERSGAAPPRVVDVRFTRPLVLPARMGLYVSGDQVLVGNPGEPAFLEGNFYSRALDDDASRSPAATSRPAALSGAGVSRGVGARPEELGR